MQEPRPITVAIERTVDSDLDRYAQAWVRHGVDLASYFSGFLGAGWVRESRGSKRWHMLYRFEDPATLEAWERSPERQQWLASGAGFASESRMERRTGIEGWFDAPQGVVVDGDRVEIRPVAAATVGGCTYCGARRTDRRSRPRTTGGTTMGSRLSRVVVALAASLALTTSCSSDETSSVASPACRYNWSRIRDTEPLAFSEKPLNRRTSMLPSSSRR